jgi:hypothetical protein
MNDVGARAAGAIFGKVVTHGNDQPLRVDSEGTSEIALGERGAERLLGRGHLLAKLEGERDLCFAQSRESFAWRTRRALAANDAASPRVR